ncbi:MAG: MMPL family transporter [Microbacteriaceae bacterium]|nr:MMPL family transporter [Microbacteriaceae bacterium]
MSQFLYRLGQFATRRAWLVIVGWIAVIGIVGGVAATAGGTFSTAMTINGTDAQTTIETLETNFKDASRGVGQVVFHKTDGLPFTDEEKESISAALLSVHDLPAVDDTVDPFETQATLDENALDIADAPAKFADGQKEIDDGQTAIDEGLTALAEARVTLADGRIELAANQKKLDKGLAKLQKAKSELKTTKAEIEAGIAYLTQLGGSEAELAELNGALAAVNGGLAQIAESRQEIRDGQAKIDAGWAGIYDGERQAKEGDKALERAQRKLDRGQAKLDDARVEFESAQIVMAGATKFRVVSEDNQTATGSVMFTTPISEVETSDKEAVVAALSETATENIQVEFSQDLTRSLGGLLGPGEIVGLLVAAIVLFVMLGTLVAAGLPVLSALVGVAISGASSVALAAVVESTTTTPILGVMLGLAVGIDYSLFILNRHRRQLKSGMPVAESIALANGTSGNSVTFAGLTVIIALAALNLTGIDFLGLMGSVGAAAIAIAVAVAVTFNPAVISLMGMRILSKKERRVLAERESHHVVPPTTSSASVFATRHPIVSLFATLAVLGITAIPLLDMRLGLPDGSSEPTDSTGYKSYHLTQDAFGEGVNATLLVVATSPAPITEDDELAFQAGATKLIMNVDNVESAVPGGFSDDRTIAIFRVVPTGGPNDLSTQTVVHDIRALDAQFRSTLDSSVNVTGMAPINIDVSEKLSQALPIYLGTVIGLSLLIMLLVFRSIWLPLIASAGFLFTVFATLGAVTAVFQWGWLGWLFDVHDPAPILSFLPTMLIGILFGLAMDYQLFLASGMREAFIHGKSATDSINYGLRLSRSVVTAAAIIMVSVFGGFIFSHTTMIRPVGFGLAAGVLIDAFLVRLVLVPAALKLIGPAAWWLPKWLDRLLPDVDVEGAKLERSVAHH